MKQLIENMKISTIKKAILAIFTATQHKEKYENPNTEETY
jgi:hypothetical protein